MDGQVGFVPGEQVWNPGPGRRGQLRLQQRIGLVERGARRRASATFPLRNLCAGDCATERNVANGSNTDRAHSKIGTYEKSRLDTFPSCTA